VAYFGVLRWPPSSPPTPGKSTRSRGFTHSSEWNVNAGLEIFPRRTLITPLPSRSGVPAFHSYALHSTVWDEDDEWPTRIGATPAVRSSSSHHSLSTAALDTRSDQWTPPHPTLTASSRETPTWSLFRTIRTGTAEENSSNESRQKSTPAHCAETH